MQTAKHTHQYLSLSVLMLVFESTKRLKPKQELPGKFIQQAGFFHRLCLRSLKTWSVY